MFGSTRNGANAYTSIGVETGVGSASPHKLIVMLFDGAMVSVSSALQHMQAGNVAKKGEAISRAISIIDNGLRASLDKKIGGEIALNLDSLYEYMSTRLMIANLKNQPAILEEIYQLLKGLKEAWEAISPKAGAVAESAAGSTDTAEQAPKATPGIAAYDSLAPHTSRLVKA